MNLALEPLVRCGLRRLRRSSNRNLFWWRGAVNFGDLIGPWIFERLAGRAPRYCTPSNRSLSTVHLTIGGILHLAGDSAEVWGSGIIAPDEQFLRPHRIHAVRGPLTRERCLAQGYPCPAVYGDPAILLPRLWSGKRSPVEPTVGVVPHYREWDEASRIFEGVPGVRLLDPRRPAAVVIDDILRCRWLASSSLHGLVVAHAFGIPALWTRFSEYESIKFQDYARGVGLPGLPEAELIVAPRTARELADLAEAWPAPDPDELLRLGDRLLESCPFVDAGCSARLLGPRS